MATTALDSMPVGTAAPHFELPDVFTGKKVTLQEVATQFPKGILVIFLCRHCPYVKHLQEELTNLAKIFMPEGMGFIGICSNDAVTYPEDAPASLKEMVEELAIPFPILADETQDVARAFTASCTPDFFLFDKDSRLAYHGRMDASTPKNGISVTGDDLRSALECVSRGETVAEPFPLALGCSIKWKEER